MPLFKLGSSLLNKETYKCTKDQVFQAKS